MLRAAWIFIVLGCAVQVAHGQGYSPQLAPQKMALHAGLEARLIASEPLVRQPVAIEFDDRGRLWVIQYLQYPNPAGLKRVQVDRFSRTQYDRVPEPPPHGTRGADRITILEDTDGDGVADKGRDFVDGLNLASGLAVGHGGVFVLNVPYLLFYPDANGDDVPDGDPEVLLSGFGMEDAHSVANSLTFGPDGWLYGCQGSTVTASVRGIEFQQGVWRYHPRTKQFELFCEGGGNSWGLDFDRDGKLLYSTNHGGYLMLHGVQGAYLWKQFGKHGALHNPYAFGFFDHAPHQNFQGGHVTVGGIVYQADLLPGLRDKYIGGDLLGHAVYWHHLQPRGSSVQSVHGDALLVANDTWFGTSDVLQGPDGAVYVTDWHDQRTAHPDPDADWDRSNGRIYRIAPSGFQSPRVRNLNQLTSVQLVDELQHSNEWYARRALRILAERRDPTIVDTLRHTALTATDEHRALKALWGLHACGGWEEPTATRLLKSPFAQVRAWTIRLWADHLAQEELLVSDDFARQLDQLAESDPSLDVRSQLAVTARHQPPAVAIPIVHSLLLRDEDAADPYIPLLLWWAIERHAITAQEAMLVRFAHPAAWRSTLTSRVILPRLMQRYASSGEASGLAACLRLLESARDDSGHRALAVALDQGLRDAAGAPSELRGSLFPGAGPAVQVAEVQSLTDKIWQPETIDPVVLRIAARLGKSAALERAAALAFDDARPIELRLQMLAVLGDMGRTINLDRGWHAFDRGQPEAWQAAWFGLLLQVDDPAAPQAIMARYSALPAAVQSRARDVLISRRLTALVLLNGVDRGEISGKDWPLEQLRAVAAHHDPRLDELVRKHWGNIAPGTPEEKLAVVRRLSNDLRAGSGEASSGKLLFNKHCANCHQLFGEGKRVGPELTTANRQDQSFLLVSMVDPSAQIRKEYMSHAIQLLDGRAFNGLIVEQSAGSITLLDAKDQRITLQRSEIDAMDESPVSLMPDQLLLGLSPQELRDLFAYLQSAETQ